MGFLEVLTIVFVVLKLTGVIAWSWWLVLLPEIIAVGIYLVLYALVGFAFGSTYRSINKKIKK